jgi:hypothetical protein
VAVPSKQTPSTRVVLVSIPVVAVFLGAGLAIERAVGDGDAGRVPSTMPADVAAVAIDSSGQGEEHPFIQSLPLEAEPGTYRRVATFATRRGAPVHVFTARNARTGRECVGLRTNTVSGMSCGPELYADGLLHVARTTYRDEYYVSGMVSEGVVRVEARGPDGRARHLPLRSRAFFLEEGGDQTVIAIDAAGREVAAVHFPPSSGD